MKKRNREVNVFSISALDLFASALGAFIVLSLIFVVFFMMTARFTSPTPPEPTVSEAVVCPEVPAPEPLVCPVVPDISALENAHDICQSDLQSQQALTASCAVERDALAERVDQVEFPHLDLVIALDVTGSMSEQVDGLKSEIDQLMEVLSRLAPSFAIGIVPFGDRLWQTPVFHQDLLEVKHSSANRARARDVISGLEVQMGLGSGDNPDGPEAILAALDAAIRSSWRPDAERKIIVVVTDNPAYAFEQLSALQTAQAFRAQGGGRAVSTVFVDTSFRTGVSSGAASFLQQLAASGGGEFVRDGGSMTANLLLSLL